MENNKYSKFGNFLARGGGQPTPTPEVLATATPEQLASYDIQRKTARNKGLGEMLLLMGDAFQGKDISGRAAQRRASRQPKKRETIKGADGYNYYLDTGERVLPGVEQKSNIDQQTTDYRNYLNTLDKASDATGAGFLAYQDRNQKNSLTEPKYAKAADGFYRWVDGPKAGQKVFGDSMERFDKDAITPSDKNLLGLSNKEIFDRENALSDDFRAGSKDFITIRDSMGKVLQSAINPSPFGDLAIIFSAMKVLDPGSVVRESEFKTVEKAAPFLTRLGFDQAKIDSFKEGKLLTATQRADVVDTVLNFYLSSNQSQGGLIEYYSDRAKKSGLNPESVIYDFGASITPKIELYNYVNTLYTLDNQDLVLESQNQTDDEKKKLILKEIKRRDK